MAAVAVISASHIPAFAQEAPAEVAPAPASQPQPQPQAQSLSPVVVTASRTAQSVADALPHTTVVTQDDIVSSQAPDLRSLLRGQAGVEFTANGGMGANTSLFMRGANSNQVLILIDGVRVSGASSGTAQLGNILPDQIDHIEVVRGNVSALYGSDAIGGVVQVFTKNGAGQAPAANAQVEYGSNNTRQGTVGYGGQIGDTSFNVTGSIFKTDGFSSINYNQWAAANAAAVRRGTGPNPGDNPYENKSVSGQIRHKFTPDWDAGFAAYYSKSDLSYDSTSGRPTDDYRMNSELYTLSAFVNGKVTAAWTTHFKLSQSEDRSEGTRNGLFDSLFSTRNRQFNWQNEYALTPDHKLLFGTDLGAAVTFQNPVDESSNTQLLRRARRHASFDVGRNFGNWRFGGEWLLSSTRLDNSGRVLGGYGIVNLNARYNIDKQWFVAARVENLFDKNYQLAWPYNTQGRAGFITLGWRQK